MNSLDDLGEDERILYLSAREVKRSTFWIYLLSEIDREAAESNAKMLTKLMQGDEKAAIIEGAKLQAYGVLLGLMQNTIEDVEQPLHQG